MYGVRQERGQHSDKVAEPYQRPTMASLETRDDDDEDDGRDAGNDDGFQPVAVAVEQRDFRGGILSPMMTREARDGVQNTANWTNLGPQHRIKTKRQFHQLQRG
ncbi:uncharacterized protein PG986_000254 [Apiospora aurea]|uniref:Uncharacterized protein n=1 Tax=Apiospora aurea TaxID=335848 RepID=A0ABR1QTG3_9PEZI